MDALNKPSTQEFARGRWPASFEEECLSATDPAETGVAGRQSARTQQPTAQEPAVRGPAATGKALMFRLHRLYYQ